VSGFRAPPSRHWQSYGTEPLPTAADALDQPLRAFPSWFLKITWDRCGKVSVFNEAHMSNQRRHMALRDILARMRRDGCAGSCYGWDRERQRGGNKCRTTHRC
jgi:hypothetical protein